MIDLGLNGRRRGLLAKLEKYFIYKYCSTCCGHLAILKNSRCDRGTNISRSKENSFKKIALIGVNRILVISAGLLARYLVFPQTYLVWKNVKTSPRDSPHSTQTNSRIFSTCR